MHAHTHTHTQILDFQWRKGFVSVLLTDVSQGPMKALATQMLACACSVAKQCPNFVTPWTIAHQAPLSMAFPRQEYWSGLPFPSAGDLPDPVIEPESPTLPGMFFTPEPSGKPATQVVPNKYAVNYQKNMALILRQKSLLANYLLPSNVWYKT